MADYQKKGFLTEDFRLFHLRSDSGTKPEFHYHEFYKILMLVSGSGAYAVEGSRYLLQPGDLVLIGSGLVHRPEFEPGAVYERIILYISPEFLRQHSTPDCDLSDCFSGEKSHVLRPDEGARKKLFDLAASMERELDRNGYGRVILSQAAVLRLLVHIGRQQLCADVPQASPLAPSNDRVVQILKYLDAHLSEDISIDALAERFYLSKFHMMRLFRRETGTTIHAYLTEHRLILARDYLSQGLSATDACYRSGWRSYSSFTRAYGKRFGTTPTGRKDTSARAEETFE